jgi:cation:H+ antiporter
MMVMTVLTISLFVFGYGFRGQGRINRFEGGLLLACYFGYTAYLIMVVLGKTT